MKVCFAEVDFAGWRFIFRSFYNYNPTVSLCGKYFQGSKIGDDYIYIDSKFEKSDVIITDDYRKVTCPDCIAKMTCEHQWNYNYAERRGYVSGDVHYICRKCHLEIQVSTNWRPGIDSQYIEQVFDTLNDEAKEMLVMNGFKCFQWIILDKEEQ
jgi:hypothetical protein